MKIKCLQLFTFWMLSFLLRIVAVHFAFNVHRGKDFYFPEAPIGLCGRCSGVSELCAPSMVWDLWEITVALQCAFQSSEFLTFLLVLLLPVFADLLYFIVLFPALSSIWGRNICALLWKNVPKTFPRWLQGTRGTRTQQRAWWGPGEMFDRNCWWDGKSSFSLHLWFLLSPRF